MRKLIAFAVASLAVAALTAIPAAANRQGPNGRIAFTRFNSTLGDDLVYTANPDGSDVKQLLQTGAEGPKWSPDGTRIAVFPHDVDGVSARIVNADAGTFTDLPMPDSDQLFLPCENWSPDGQRLSCDGFGLSDGGLDGIYTIRSSDGGGLQRVTSNPNGEDCPGNYSPDGKRLVFFRQNDTTFALFTVKVDGTDLRQISPDDSTQFDNDFDCGSWSPQGNEILFSAHVPDDQRNTVWMVHSDGTGLHRVPIPGCGGSRNDPSTIGCFSANWSPDGTKIVFERFSNSQGDVYTVNPDGTNLTEVVGTPDDEGGPPNWGTHPLAPRN